MSRTIEQLKVDADLLRRERRESSNVMQSHALVATGLETKLRMIEAENQHVTTALCVRFLRPLVLVLATDAHGCIFDG